METNPQLIEPGVKYFIGGTLKECRKFKDKHISLLFNVLITALFMSGLAMLLLFRYKGKKTQLEQSIQDNQKREYIMTKLKTISMEKTKQERNNDMITNIPSF